MILEHIKGTKLVTEGGKPTEFCLFGIPRPPKEAIEFYGLNEAHDYGQLYAEPFTEMNALLSARQMEDEDEEYFKIVKVVDAPEAEWEEGVVY